MTLFAGISLLTLVVITALAIVHTTNLFVAVMLSGVFSLLMALPLVMRANPRERKLMPHHLLKTPLWRKTISAGPRVQSDIFRQSAR